MLQEMLYNEMLPWICGIFLNFYFILKLLIRPKLWSTTNTFLGFFLLFNLFFLLFQVLLIDGEVSEYKSEIIQFLEYLFLEKLRAVFCSGKYIAHVIYITATLNILIGSIFIRSMMVRHANNIRQDSYQCKSHQARLRFIGFLVTIFILTFITGVVIVLFISHLFPFDFVDVRNCRGALLVYSTEERKKIWKAWLSRCVVLVLLAVAVVSSHIRIINYKRRHDMSYFSQFRQNIATVDQSLAAAYLLIVLSLIDETIYFCLIMDMHTVMDIMEFRKVTTMVCCIMVPGYWLYSTVATYPELWSDHTMFNRRVHQARWAAYTDKQEMLIEPRRPDIGDRVSNEDSRIYLNLHSTTSQVLREVGSGLDIDMERNNVTDYGNTASSDIHAVTAL